MAHSSAAASGRNNNSTDPRVFYDPFNDPNKASVLAAVSENRLEQCSAFSVAGPSNIASMASITGGALAFLTLFAAAALAISVNLAHSGGAVIALQGFAFPSFIVINICTAYAMISGHNTIQVFFMRLFGGSPVLTLNEAYIFTWMAPQQGYSRKAYIAILLAPFATALIIWLMCLLLLPMFAGYLLAPLAVSAALLGPDAWLAAAANKTEPSAAVFAIQGKAFIAYRAGAAAK